MESTATLFQRQGYPATAVKQVVEAAGAPFGSLYHHFPGGKEELAEEVIRTSGAMYGQLVDLVFDPAPDVTSAVRDFFAGAAETLRQTEYADACPIETVALEVASTNDRLRRATADVFEGWTEKAAERFIGAGIDPETARALALSFICLLEGAFVLSRAARTTEALDVAGATAVRAVEDAVRRSAGATERESG